MNPNYFKLVMGRKILLNIWLFFLHNCLVLTIIMVALSYIWLTPQVQYIFIFAEQNPCSFNIFGTL